jgi:hypothetical protein
MAQIIKTNGEIINITPNEGCNELSLQQLKEAVEGYIEMVPMNNPAYDGKIMFCNEDGHRLEKRLNPVASLISNQTIVGNVIICEKGEVS